MKGRITIFLAGAALAAVVLVGTALGAADSASDPQAGKGAVVALGKTALGRVLVEGRGRTVYLFGKDGPRGSRCNGACAAYWPPLLSSAKPRAGKGVRASLLGLTTRADGKRQVTYAGHPLYTFASDSKAGQTGGQGLTEFGGIWYVLAASGRAVVRSSGDSDGGYGGYGG